MLRFLRRFLATWLCLVLAQNQAAADTRLERTVLATNLVEPIALEVAADGRVIFAERRGAVKAWQPDSGNTVTLGTLNGFTGPEDGLLGLALHPGFVTNGWIFLYHATPGVLENRVSRFTVVAGTLDLASQRVLLRIPTLIPKPNHSGGGLGFDAPGNLYVSTGDYTYADKSDGYALLAGPTAPSTCSNGAATGGTIGTERW